MTRIRMVCSLAPALLAVALFGGCDDGDSGSDGTGGTGGAVTADGGMGGTGGAGGAVEVSLASLEVSASDELTRYNDVQLTVTAVMSDGSRQAVAEGVTWASSDEEITTVTAAGEAHGVKMGPATVTATYEGVSATWATEVGCRYPNFPNAVRFNNTMPALGWADAHNPDGSQFRFTMEDFYCAEEYDQYTSMIMMIKAAWCAPCTAYAQQRLNPAADSLGEDGALIVYVEAQDLDGVPSDSAYAYNHMRRLIGEGAGIRVGDASTMATIPSEISLPAYLQQTDLVVAFPTILIVRRHDMKVIAESARTQLSLPLERIVNDLEADYSEITIEFVNQCAEGDEEASEPNDDQATAQTVGAGTYEGGICAAAPDVYEIDIDGPWRATVNFTHATGDIDLAVYLPDSEQPETSSLSGDDNEMVEFQGRAFLTIFGYNGASAPYTLIVEAL
jgi:hypothetical protein